MCVCVYTEIYIYIFIYYKYIYLYIWYNWTHLSLSVANSLPLHGLKHARLPFLYITNSWSLFKSCLSSWWCHPTISSSVLPFSSWLQYFPAPGSFLMSQSFTSGGQSTEVSALASILPVNIQNWFPLGWTSLISLQSKALSRVFSNIHSSKASIIWFSVQLSYP